MRISDNISQKIKDFNAPFLPDQVKLKYKLMAEGPYYFFAGTCHLYYDHLSKEQSFPPSPAVWMCGDLHVENLGTFKGDNRLVYFDLNDFDEAILGPANWELVRLLTSIFVIFKHLGIEEKKALKWVNLFLESYSKTLEKGKAKYIETRTAKGIVKKFIDAVCKRKQFELIRRYTKKKKKGLLLLTDEKKLFKLNIDLKNELIQHIKEWLSQEKMLHSYKVIDCCFRVAGTGSLGLKRYLFLLKNPKAKKEFLLLDMKEATPSSVQPYLTIKQPKWETEAIRVVTIQQRLQNIPPAHLSATSFKGDSYVVQEMQSEEDKINFSLIKSHYRDVCDVISSMAILTASAQLRSCSRQGSATADEIIEFGKKREFLSSLIHFAHIYSVKVIDDYNYFLSDYKSGFFNS